MNGLESAVAAQGDLFLVAGNFAPSNPQYVFVFGTRIRGSDGAKLDSSPIAVGSSFSLHPEVAPVGSRWLVIWEQHPSHDDPHASVVGNFVDVAGVPSTAFGIGGMGAYNLAPAIAANGDTALVAWSESRLGFNNLDIYGRRVLPNGTLLDAGELALSTGANSQTLPALAWDGNEFISLFQDPRNIPYFFDEHLDVYGARVSAGGSVQDPAGFAVANDPVVSEIQPAVAGGGGIALLGCSVYRPQSPVAAFRAGLRLGPINPVAASVSGLDGSSRVGIRLSAVPNPSAGSFELRIQGVDAGGVDLSIFDVTGREITRLRSGSGDGGEARVIWDGRDARRSRVPAGLYFARLNHAGSSRALKLTVR
jgi:hypothetical protein